MIGYNNEAPKAVNNVGQFGATEGTIGAYKSAAEYAADAKYWALLSQTKYSSVEDILAEVERLYAQGLLLEEDIKQLKTDFETQQQDLLGLIQSTGTAIDNTNAATELSKEATQEVLAQLDIISNMTVQTALLPPGSLATGSYDNTTGVFSFGIPEGQPGRDGTDGTISDIGSVSVGVPVSDDYGFYVDKDNGGLYRASMSDIANLVPSIRSISINGGEEQTGAVSFNSVSSFNNRTGDVLPMSGDYSVGQVTGAAASGINSDITSLEGLTTALSVAQGGTGASTPEEARTNLELGSVSVENVVPILKGGTGASTAEGARTNLGLGLVATESIVPITKGGTGATSSENARLALVSAKSGDNYDITSLNNLTTALSVSQGGTGAGTPDAAWLNIRPTGSTPLSSDPINPLDATTKRWTENYVKPTSRELFRRSLAEAGITLVAGSFEEGATINNASSAVWSIAEGQCYTWGGTFNKIVPANSTPSTTGGVSPTAWISVSSRLLRSALGSAAGSSLVNHTNGKTVGQNIDLLTSISQYVTPEQFYSNHPGETDWAIMINEAYEYARDNNKSVLLANEYHIATTIKHYDGVNVTCSGRIIASPSGSYSFTTTRDNTENAAYIITTKNGTFNNAKSVSIRGLTLTHTANREPSGYTDTHIAAKGVVITDIANVYISDLQTFGFLNGGVDVGGISGNGYEIVIDKCLSWLYSWTDSEKIGFRCNVTDSTFRDIVTVAYGIGIHNVKGGGNVYFNPHPWGYPLTTSNTFPNRQCKLHFLLTGGGSTFIRPYADTITRLDSAQGSSRSNGGIGFYVENWRNKIISADALLHNDDVNTGMSLVYLKGDASRNEIEFMNVTNASKLTNERVTYDGDYLSALFTNDISVPKYVAGNLANLTGSISFNASGVTSSGSYNLRRSGDHVDISIFIAVSAINSPSGALSITLPRGLTCQFGPTVEPSQSSCLANISSTNIGVIAVLNGTSIDFYYKTAAGARTQINAGGVSTGALELYITGIITN